MCTTPSQDPTSGINTIALPNTCGEIDIANHPLASSVPYMKGAFFLRQVAEAIGPELLDTALGEFYRLHVGNATRMQMLVNLIRSKIDVSHRAGSERTFAGRRGTFRERRGEQVATLR